MRAIPGARPSIPAVAPGLAPGCAPGRRRFSNPAVRPPWSRCLRLAGCAPHADRVCPDDFRIARRDRRSEGPHLQAVVRRPDRDVDAARPSVPAMRCARRRAPAAALPFAFKGRPCTPRSHDDARSRRLCRGIHLGSVSHRERVSAGRRYAARKMMATVWAHSAQRKGRCRRELRSRRPRPCRLS